MLNDEEIFDKVMCEEGYWSHYENGEPRIIQALEHARGYATASVDAETKEGTLVPYVNVSDDEQINALAFHESGRDCIALTRGAIEINDALFLTMLSFSAVFPEVGDAAKMVDPPTWSSLPSSWTSSPEAPIPQDENRAFLAMVLSTFLLDYQIFHEIGHIWRGHVRMPEAEGGKLLLKEVIGSGAATEEQLLFDQALEVDADDFAVATMLVNIESCITGQGAYRKIAAKTGWALRDVVRYWLFAVYSFHRLFSDGPLDVGELASKKHPLPRVRQAWIIQTVAAHCDAGTFGMQKKDFLEIAKAVAIEAEEAFALLLNQTAETTQFLTNQDPLVDQHLDRVRVVLDRLDPRFNELGYRIWRKL